MRSLLEFPMPTSVNRKIQHQFLSSNVWSKDLDSQHPILKNHTVHGRGILPGLAWIDFLFQWFSELGFEFNLLELRNLSIYHPLIVSDKTVNLTVIATEHKLYWTIVVADDHDLNPIQYITAEMHVCSSVHFNEKVDLDSIIEKTELTIPLQKIYARCRSQKLVHSECMKVKGQAYRLSDAIWVELRLEQAHFDKTEHYIFHPALIDSSGIGSTELFDIFDPTREQLFLPLFYEVFRAEKSITNVCYTRIEEGSLSKKEEIITLNMDFFDENGNKIAELVNFKNKLVRHPGLINPDYQSSPRMDSQPIISSSIVDLDKKTTGSIASFIRALIAKHLGVDEATIETDVGYYQLGLDSPKLLAVVRSIENYLSTKLSPTLLFEYTTIDSLVNHLTEHYGHSGASSSPDTYDSDTKFIYPTHAPMPIGLISPNKTPSNQDIAIIGMSGRYPMANNLAEFWGNLREGKDCITEIPEDRWRSNFLKDAQSPSGKKASKWGGFIDDVAAFDAQFFRVSPREAESMDPQERQFLEVCWEAMEDAGYTSETIVSGEGPHQRKPVGVFVGVMHKDYTLIQAEAVLQGVHTQMSLSHAPIANRVSYFCNFHGPSMVIDTVCSSSLIAVHLAIESICRGESRVAFAGGVNLSLHPNKYLTYTLMDLHSSDGYCRTFGADGDGYVSAEGVGAVLLKPLMDAIADGDNIYAVIKGSGTNHGGTASGITVPSSVAQGDMIAACLRKAQIDPETIGYIEAHGTGTSLGDPIEIKGLNQAFGQFTTKKQFCALGSVKSNIGHAESAAGISGLTKTILQLHHKTLVKSLHSEIVNPYLDLVNSPFYIQTCTEPWTNSSSSFLRRAAVSSFGASGSNAHVILEEAPARALLKGSKPYYLITLSAKTAEALVKKKIELSKWIHNNKSAHVADIGALSFTLNAGREHFNHRAAWVVKDLNEFEKQLLDVNESVCFQGIVVKKPQVNDNPDLKKALNDSARLFSNSNTNAKQQLNIIANFYVKGYAIDWFLLYQNEPKQRLSLPTYPFAKESFWVPSVLKSTEMVHQVPSEISTSFKTSSQVSFEKSEKSMGYYVPSWDERVLEGDKGRLESYWRGRYVLVFSDDVEQISGIAEAMSCSQRGITLIQVSSGSSYECLSSCHYRVMAGHRLDYERLLLDVSLSYPLAHWDCVLDLWGLDISWTDDLSLGLAKGSYHLLGLSQVLLARKETSVRLLHVYSRSELVLSLDAMNGGFVRTLREEHGSYRYQLVGVEKGIGIKALSALIETELAFGDEAEVRYVDGQREVHHFIEKEVAPIGLNENRVLRKDGVYLITGGLGGLGFIFARYLSEHYSARMILTGRSDLDSQKQQQIKTLEDLGGKVRYVAGDISKREDVAQILEACEAFGELNGIIHAAGVIRDSYINNKTSEDMGMVLGPKIFGAWWLDNLTKHNKALDWVIFFSSIAILGNAGQADYAVANMFLNHFAHYREQLRQAGQRSGRTVSINWPLWLDGGMHIDAAAQKLLFHTFGMDMLSTEMGLSTWLRILHSEDSEVLTVYGDQVRFQQKLMHQSVGALNNADILATDEREQQLGLLQQHFVTLVSDVLKLPVQNISLSEPLSQYGFDSIGLTELSNRLNADYGSELTPALFYQYSTIGLIVDYFIDRYPQLVLNRHEKQLSLLSKTIPKKHSNYFTQSLLPKEANLTAPIRGQDIAIIGMAGIFPGAKDVDSLWSNLLLEKDAIRAFPEDRVELHPAKEWINWGGFIDDIAKFDASFFNISPREAELMDPQQRIFLETVCKSIENAGYGIDGFAGTRCGLFAGIQLQEYAKLIEDCGEYDGYVGTGNSHSILTNRISYLLNLLGPSEAIDTACSSALVAIHRAIQSIQLGESDLAIAGGVNGLLSASGFIGCVKAGMLSPEGRCKSFDKSANGYVRGEGAGAIVLKPLSQALLDGDTIHGVIKGSAVNHGGHATSLTAPNPNAQAALIKTACRNAGISVATISYIEAHGTGTSLGDPIEINGLKKAFKELSEEDGIGLAESYCGIGSVKTNIGHLETAAGIAGVIKTLLAMKHGELPASLHCSELNPYIELAESPFYITTQKRTWSRLQDAAGHAIPRRAGVSSFGFGGSNAHIILEEAPERAQVVDTKPYYLVALSAKTSLAFIERQRELLAWLDLHSDAALESISYTLNVGRSHYDHRGAWVVSDVAMLRAGLQASLAEKRLKTIFIGVLNSQTLPDDDAIYKRVLKSLLDDLITQNSRDSEYQDVLAALANLYVKGYSINWSLLHHGETKQRIALPTYSFARDHHWIASLDKKYVENQSPSFSELLYAQWLQDLIDGNLTVDTTAEKIKKAMLDGVK